MEPNERIMRTNLAILVSVVQVDRRCGVRGTDHVLGASDQVQLIPSGRSLVLATDQSIVPRWIRVETSLSC